MQDTLPEPGTVEAMAAEVAALSRKISALTGRLTVMGNRLNHQDGLISAATVSMRATVKAGNRLSVNQLTERFSLSRGTATTLRHCVLAESNGHPSE